MLTKLLLPVLFIAFFANMAFAQTGSITGTVTNEEGEPVPTANVLLVEIGRGAATNLNGEYTIENVELGTYTLRVTFVGYQDYTTEVTIEAGQTVTQNVTVQRSAVGLEELIVTGFGRESKIEFSGSAAQVDVSQQIKNVPVVNVSQALQGSVAGLQISSFTGTPGTGQNINIRGISSINAGGSPLVVVDGIPVTTGSTEAYTASSDIGLLATINPQSIESVTVLKGPVATAQYGARGSNGVIVITTKRGTAGEMRYSFSLQRGTISRAVDGPESLNAFQSAKLYIEGLQNAGIDVPDDYDIPKWNGPRDNRPGVVNANWKDLITNHNALTQSYRLSASGGTERATFYGSISYQNKDHIVISSKFNRFAANLNFSYGFNENIDISNQFMGSYSSQDGFLEASAWWDNPVTTRYFMPSFYSAYDGDPESLGGIYNLAIPVSQYNTLFTTNRGVNTTQSYRIINSTKLNIDITDNLSFHSEVGIDFTLSEEERFDNRIHGDGAALNGEASAIMSRVFRGSFQNGLNYIWNINEENTLETRVVGSAQLYEFFRTAAYGSGFATAGLTNLASASVPRWAFSEALDGSLLSVLGKIHYGFQDKIFIDATLRYEGSSKFAEGHRWGTFYGVGATYLISQDFFTNAGWLDLLKVRASYGLTGNNDIGRNLYQSALGFSSSYNNGGAIVYTQLGNVSLTWEKAKKINAGVTFGLFNRIDSDITLFRSKSFDLLYNVPLSFTTGFENRLTNVGTLVNKGLEFALSADLVRTEDLLVAIEGNFTWLKNEVTNLPADATGQPLTIISSRWKYFAVEGYAVGSWYMPTYAGVNAHNGSPLWYLNREPTQQEINSGAVFKLDRFENRWLTSTYSLAESVYQGASGYPTKYGSISLRINYKGFYARASLYGSFGNKVYDIWAPGYLATDGATPLVFFGGYTSQLQRWQEPGDITDVPKRVYLNTSNSTGTSTRYLYDGDYLRLQQVRIGYNVPASLLNGLNIGLRSLNVFLVGRNLYTYIFDDELRYDPETGNAGRIDLQSSALQSITFGINLQF